MSKNKEMSYQEINVFCEQLTMILKSGISVYEGVLMLRNEVSNSFEKDVFAEIVEQMDLGVNFPQALSSTNAFPHYMIIMVEIGEVSGRLDNVLQQLSYYYIREEKTRKSVRNAFLYPMTMVCIMLGVMGVLVVQVLPIFNSVFIQLGSELTGFSKAVMDIGLALTKYSSIILAVVVCLGVITLWLCKSKLGKTYLSIMKSKFFLTRTLSNQIATSRFAGGLSFMLASGLDIDKSLEMSQMLIEDKEMEAKIKKCRNHINEGASFAEAIEISEIFSGIYRRMLVVGFKTGAIDEAMSNISKRYEDEVENKLSSIVSIIEPSLVAFLSIVVGMVLLSVMLPLMGIMSTI